MTRLIFVEGLPGSGKTSAAKNLARSLRGEGFDASWIHELAPEHPVIPPRVVKQAGQHGYPQLCLDQWEAFVANAEPRQVRVLEGCAFQATVRFMYANRVAGSAIRSYWDSFERLIAPLAPRFVYLYQAEPVEFMQTRTIVRRGDDWLAKVAAYTEATPRSQHQGWRGRDGMISFWMGYREVCDDLYERSQTSKLAIENSGQFWSREHLRIAEWVLDPVPASAPGPAAAKVEAGG